MLRILLLFLSLSLFSRLGAQSFEKLSLPSNERLMFLKSSGENIFALIYTEGSKKHVNVSLVKYSDAFQRIWVQNIDSVKSAYINSSDAGVMVQTPKGEACVYQLHVFGDRIIVARSTQYFGDYVCSYHIFDRDGHTLPSSAALLADPTSPWVFRCSDDSSVIVATRLQKGGRNCLEYIVHDKQFNEVASGSVLLSYKASLFWIDGPIAVSNDRKLCFTGRVFEAKPPRIYIDQQNLAYSRYKNILFIYDLESKKTVEVPLRSRYQEVVQYRMDLNSADKMVRLFTLIDEQDSRMMKNGCVGIGVTLCNYGLSQVVKDTIYRFDSLDVKLLVQRGRNKIDPLFIRDVYKMDGGDLCVVSHRPQVLVYRTSDPLSHDKVGASSMLTEWYLLAYVISADGAFNRKFKLVSLPHEIRSLRNKLFFIGSSVPDPENPAKRSFSLDIDNYDQQYSDYLTESGYSENKLYCEEVLSKGTISHVVDFKEKVYDCLGNLPDGSLLYSLQSNSSEVKTANTYLKVKL